MHIRSLVLGSIAALGLGYGGSSWASEMADPWFTPDFVRSNGSGVGPRHRSSGCRAHRRWRARRSSGRR